MDYRLIDHPTAPYVETLEGRIENDSHALELVAACGEHRTHRLLIRGEHLADDFFNLRSGLAGAVLLKFSNYFIKVAVLLPPDPTTQDRAYQGRFGEMTLEANRSNREFHIFTSCDQAVSWLVGD